MEILKTAKISGHITEIKVVNEKTGSVRYYPCQDNLITNAALSRINNTTISLHSVFPLGNVESVTNGCLVLGTGSSEPSVSDTSLANAEVITNDNGPDGQLNGRETGNPYYCFRRKQFKLDEGPSGNYTEFGLESDNRTGTDVINDAGTLMTRQLFRDEEGNPIAVTKLSDEILLLTYEIRFMFFDDDRFDFTGTVTSTRDTHNFRIGFANFLSTSSNNFWLNGIASPGLSASRVVVTTNDAQTNLSFDDLRLGPATLNNLSVNNGSVGALENNTISSIPYRTRTITVSPSIDAGSYGVEWIAYGGSTNFPSNRWNGSGIYIKFDPPIIKTTDEEFSLRIGVSFDRA